MRVVSEETELGRELEGLGEPLVVRGEDLPEVPATAERFIEAGWCPDFEPVDLEDLMGGEAPTDLRFEDPLEEPTSAEDDAS